MNGERSEKSKYGSTSELVKSEVEQLHPTISMPVSIALFELGETWQFARSGEDKNGIPDGTKPGKVKQ